MHRSSTMTPPSPPIYPLSSFNNGQFLACDVSTNQPLAFFTIAPSMQKRSIDRTGGAGQKAMDAEVNKAAMDVLRLLGDYPVTATGGACLTPFLGSDGHAYAFVEENSWPEHGGAIYTDIYYKGKLIASEHLDHYESKLIRLD